MSNGSFDSLESIVITDDEVCSIVNTIKHLISEEAHKRISTGTAAHKTYSIVSSPVILEGAYLTASTNQNIHPGLYYSTRYTENSIRKRNSASPMNDVIGEYSTTTRIKTGG